MAKLDYQKMWTELHNRVRNKQREAFEDVENGPEELQSYSNGRQGAFANVMILMYNIEKMNS